MSHALVTTIPPLTYRSQPFDRMGLLQPSNYTPWAIEPRRAGRKLNSAERGRIRLSSDTRYQRDDEPVNERWILSGITDHRAVRNLKSRRL